jgi:hypothetical protein
MLKLSISYLLVSLLVGIWYKTLVVVSLETLGRHVIKKKPLCGICVGGRGGGGGVYSQQANPYLTYGAFTLDVKSVLNENIGGTQC